MEELLMPCVLANMPSTLYKMYISGQNEYITVASDNLYSCKSDRFRLKPTYG